MGSRKPLEELHKRSTFYDEDVFEDFQDRLVNDLELEIENTEKEIKNKLSIIEKENVNLEKLKNLILSKYNSGVILIYPKIK